MTTLPELFFRIRDNGAAVFRLDGQNRDRRVEYEQIAVVNTNRGDFKATGDHDLTEAEESAISAWMAERIALLNRRETDDIPRVIDQINLTAHWAQRSYPPGGEKFVPGLRLVRGCAARAPRLDQPFRSGRGSEKKL